MKFCEVEKSSVREIDIKQDENKTLKFIDMKQAVLDALGSYQGLSYSNLLSELGGGRPLHTLTELSAQITTAINELAEQCCIYTHDSKYFKL